MLLETQTSSPAALGLRCVKWGHRAVFLPEAPGENLSPHPVHLLEAVAFLGPRAHITLTTASVDTWPPCLWFSWFSLALRSGDFGPKCIISPSQDPEMTTATSPLPCDIIFTGPRVGVGIFGGGRGALLPTTIPQGQREGHEETGVQETWHSEGWWQRKLTGNSSVMFDWTGSSSFFLGENQGSGRTWALPYELINSWGYSNVRNQRSRVQAQPGKFGLKGTPDLHNTSHSIFSVQLSPKHR